MFFQISFLICKFAINAAVNEVPFGAEIKSNIVLPWLADSITKHKKVHRLSYPSGKKLKQETKYELLIHFKNHYQCT